MSAFEIHYVGEDQYTHAADRLGLPGRLTSAWTPATFRMGRPCR